MHRHADFSTPINSPADFAAQLRYDLSRIAKTLLVRSTTGEIHALVVSPVGKKIDFAAVARLLGVKRVQVAPSEVLERLTGYPEQGVSPLGVENSGTESIRVLMDDSLFAFETILIGAGESGVEIEISPVDLQALTSSIRAPLARLS